jgi:hypothetical protein
MTARISTANTIRQMPISATIFVVLMLLTTVQTAIRADETGREPTFCADLSPVPGLADRHPIGHRHLGLFGTAIRALIDDPAPPGCTRGLDSADHHQAFGIASRAMEIGRERIADFAEMT